MDLSLFTRNNNSMWSSKFPFDKKITKYTLIQRINWIIQISKHFNTYIIFSINLMQPVSEMNNSMPL